MIIKQFLEEILNEFDINDEIYIFLENEQKTPLAARITTNEIVWSEENFAISYLRFSNFLKEDGYNIIDCIDSYYFITKCCLAHEIGHLLDIEIKDKLSKLKVLYNKTTNCNNVYEFNLFASNFKNTKIEMEEKAWEIAETIIGFKNDFEKIIFNKIKSYALNSYYSTKYNI